MDYGDGSDKMVIVDDGTCVGLCIFISTLIGITIGVIIIGIYESFRKRNDT